VSIIAENQHHQESMKKSASAASNRRRGGRRQAKTWRWATKTARLSVCVRVRAFCVASRADNVACCRYLAAGSEKAWRQASGAVKNGENAGISVAASSSNNVAAWWQQKHARCVSCFRHR